MLNFANLSDLEEVNKKFGYGFSKGQFGKPIVFVITPFNEDFWHYLKNLSVSLELSLSLLMERRLTKAITLLITEMQTYFTITETIYASIDRLTNKSKMVIAELEKI